jgi:hypothetical protein
MTTLANKYINYIGSHNLNVNPMLSVSERSRIILRQPLQTNQDQPLHIHESIPEAYFESEVAYIEPE